MTLAFPDLWIPRPKPIELPAVRPWWMPPMVWAAHLKKHSISKHLVKIPAGHLTKACARGCPVCGSLLAHSSSLAVVFSGVSECCLSTWTKYSITDQNGIFDLPYSSGDSDPDDDFCVFKLTRTIPVTFTLYTNSSCTPPADITQTLSGTDVITATISTSGGFSANVSRSVTTSIGGSPFVAAMFSGSGSGASCNSVVISNTLTCGIFAGGAWYWQGGTCSIAA